MSEAPTFGRKERPRILVVDDPTLSGMFQESLSHDLPQCDVHACINVGAAFELMSRESYDCLVVEAYIPYGRGAGILRPETDRHVVEAGIRFLKRVREFEKERGLKPCWMFLLTTQSYIEADLEIKKLLGNHGRVVTKPFDDIEFSFIIADALDVSCALNPDLRKGFM